MGMTVAAFQFTCLLLQVLSPKVEYKAVSTVKYTNTTKQASDQGQRQWVDWLLDALWQFLSNGQGLL